LEARVTDNKMIGQYVKLLVWSFAKKIDETVVLKGSGPIGSKGN